MWPPPSGVKYSRKSIDKFSFDTIKNIYIYTYIYILYIYILYKIPFSIHETNKKILREY